MSHLPQNKWEHLLVPPIKRYVKKLLIPPKCKGKQVVTPSEPLWKHCENQELFKVIVQGPDLILNLAQGHQF